MLTALLAACQPALNWREVRPAQSGAVALFPCKPDVEQRGAQAGQGAMGLAQCETAGLRVALSWAEVPDASQAGAALKAMSASLATKLSQPLPPVQPLQVPGMTPLPETAQYRLAGKGGVTHLAVFAHGGHVYQALMSADKDDAAAWENFVGSLRVGASAKPGG